MEQKKSDKIRHHAANYASLITHLPPIFADSTPTDSITWESLDNIDYDIIGRILVSHLCIESFINKYLQIKSSSALDLMNANLTFNQKLKIVKREFSSMPVDFYTGITLINKIRNRFSHNLNSEILASEIGLLKKIQSEYYAKDYEAVLAERTTIHAHASINKDIRVIEDFTNLFCSFLAGACTMAVL